MTPQFPNYFYGNPATVTWNVVTNPSPVTPGTATDTFSLYSDPTSTIGLRTSLVYYSAVPEPSSTGLLALGLGTVLLHRRRKA